jgi:hypothetical protein
MKRLIILLMALIPFVSNCKKENQATTNDPFILVREKAWNFLSGQDKSTVTANWREAPVTDATYNDKNTYVVTFRTSNEALLGPIMVYVDKATLVALGVGLRL